MKCPACTQELTEFVIGGVTVDACEGGCAGIWFDAFELQRVDDQHEIAGETVLNLQRDSKLVVDQSRKRDCPRCAGIKLSRNRGHQNALLAGLFTAPGDVLVSIDATWVVALSSHPQPGAVLQLCHRVGPQRALPDVTASIGTRTSSAYIVSRFLPITGARTGAAGVAPLRAQASSLV